MTASAGAWYRVGTVNVTNGNQSVVGVDTNWQSDVIAIAIGDIFTLDAKTWYEVTAVNSDTSITLDRGFEGSTGTNKTYAILRNTSGTILTRIAGQVSVQFNQKQLFLDELRTWLNSGNAAEELTDSHGLKQSLKTPSQMVRDHDSKLAELDAIHPHPYAMRKVEFEARRAANNEKFAASGFVHLGKHRVDGDNYQVVNEGLYTHLGLGNTLQIGSSNNKTGESKTDFPVANITGVLSSIVSLCDANYSRIKFPPAEDGTRTYDSETGNSVTHSTPAIAFASETDTNKVVTDRVDMWGLEALLREIHDGDPFVYKNGLIQSQSADIDGVTTVTDNVRPETYFAWYEGGTGNIGKGVNWQTATEAQRTAIASNPENNIYFDDETGKFYQWSIRGRSFAGIGNGDWDTIDASRNANLTLRQQPVGTSQRTPPQGLLNTSPISGDGSNYYSNTDSEYNLDPKIGLFTSRRNDVSSGGFSYFLVCGTVNRLNKGAYHPSHNPMGAASTVSADGNGNVVGSYWHTGHSLPISDKSQCFNNQPYGAANAVAGSYDNTGSLESVSAHKSGRPDGRFYDAIYASGQGGVCRDMRYSAWGLTPSDFAEADLKVKSGKYRGRETLTKIKTVTVGSVNSRDETFGLYTTAGRVQIYGKDSKGINFSSSNFKIGDLFKIYNTITGEVLFGKIYVLADSNIWVEDPENISSGWGFGSATNSTEGIYIEEVELINSVSSEYRHTEVIGNPTDIAQCDDLKDGWVGSWNPKIPDGTGLRFPLTRKVINTSDDICFYSGDLGDSWLSTTSAFNLIESSNSVAHPSVFNTGNIVVYQYSASAKYTENAENMPIFGGYAGIGHVIASSDAFSLRRGMLLRESLIGKPAGLSSYNNGAVQSMRPNVTTLDRDTLIGATRAAYGPAHDPIVIDGSTSLSGVKALNYNLVEKQQGFIQYAYTELKYDGDWGDDGKIYIADNQSTRLDDNGNTVLYGTARIVEPLGWIKNDK
jgi:hypothetical protein